MSNELTQCFVEVVVGKGLKVWNWEGSLEYQRDCKELSMTKGLMVQGMDRAYKTKEMQDMGVLLVMIRSLDLIYGALKC